MIVCPGRRRPSRSAVSIIFTAMRSLMLPVGLNPSSFAKIRTSGLGHSRLIRTIGVEPMHSRIFSFTIKCAFNTCKDRFSRRNAEIRGRRNRPPGPGCPRKNGSLFADSEK